MFLPDPDSWPYTNLLESIYRGNSANTDGTLSEIAAAYREREERRVAEGWEAHEHEKEKSETKEVRRKLPERALKILHLFFQNISPSPSPAQQTDLLTYIHTTIPGAEWFGINNLRAWFISRRSEGTARRLLDEVVAGQGLRRSEEVQVQVQVRAQEVREAKERIDETCESILYPTLTTPKITKLAILYRNNPTPNKNAIEVWARALKADVEDVRNWVQIHGGGGGNIPPPVVNSHRQNPPPFPVNVVPQHTPIPWWPSTTPSSTVPHPTSSSPPPLPSLSPPSPPPPPPSHSSPSTPPRPQPQHIHEADTPHIPYRRHPAVPHHFRTPYRGASAQRRPVNPYGRVYRPPVEVCPTATTTGQPRPFSLSSVRRSPHPTPEAHTRRGGGLRPVHPRPSTSPSTGLIPLSSTATTTVPKCDDGEELFDLSTLRDLVSVPAQYRQPLSHTLPHIFPPSHPHRPPHPYPHLLRHLFAHAHPHAHSHDFNQETSRQTSESSVVNQEYEYEYASAARSSLSAVVPPSFDFDLGPSVFSSTAHSGSAVVDLTGIDDNMDAESECESPLPTTEDVGPPLSSAVVPPTNLTPPLDPPADDEDEDDSEPMDLESDDDDAPSIFELRHHLAKEPKVRRNLLAELANFVHERLAYSQAHGSVGLAKGEQFDFDAALGVCEVFYERIRSGVYAGIGRGLVLREVDLC